MADLVGKYRQMTVDYKTHDALVTFAIKADLETLEGKLNELEDKEILIKLSAYTPKRSLTANAYFHSLVREIAKRIDRTEIWTKNKLISQYGQVDMLKNGECATLKGNIDFDSMWSQDILHVRPCGVKLENGKEVYFYRVMRPSHTYSTKEMAELINGTVDEAKDLGIPTISDAEVERLLNAWGKG